MLRVAPWRSTEVHGGRLRSQQIAGLVHRALSDSVQCIAEHPRSLLRPALAARSAAETAAGRIRPAESFDTGWIDDIMSRQGLRRGDVVLYDAGLRDGPALLRIIPRRGLRVVALSHKVEALKPKNFPIDRALLPGIVGAVWYCCSPVQLAVSWRR